MSSPILILQNNDYCSKMKPKRLACYIIPTNEVPRDLSLTSRVIRPNDGYPKK